MYVQQSDFDRTKCFIGGGGGGGGGGLGVIACSCLGQKMTGSKTREKYLVIVLRLGKHLHSNTYAAKLLNLPGHSMDDIRIQPIEHITR